MNAIGGFIHLYHVWGIWGLITAGIYGPAAWREWRLANGRVITAPVEYGAAAWFHVKEAGKDVARIFAGLFRGVFGIGPEAPPHGVSPWRYQRDHMLMMGITLGGISRFLTALYWAEKNRGWMSSQGVAIASIPVLIAVIADAHHHHAAWPDKPWRPRLLKLAAAAWIAWGLWG